MTKETQQQINLIETKIEEIKSTLTLWNKEIENYTLTLKELTNQLQEIKLQIKK